MKFVVGTTWVARDKSLWRILATDRKDSAFPLVARALEGEEVNEFPKVIRDGNVAVLYSPRFGAGWYSWNKEVPQCLFHPTIVEMVQDGRQKEITSEFCEKLFDVEGFYAGGAEDLRIEWMPAGTQFLVEEYDGNESFRYNDDREPWVTA